MCYITYLLLLRTYSSAGRLLRAQCACFRVMIAVQFEDGVQV
jgi:hypothetical protein